MIKNIGHLIYDYPSSYVLVDIETTGLNPKEEEIIEIGAYKVVDNKVIDKFERLIKPTKEISEYIESLTHISNDMVKDADTIDIVIKDFDEFLGDSLIMGHNITFDLSFLTESFYNCLGRYLLNDYVDTLFVARKLLKDVPNHKLQTLSEYYTLDIEGEHRALKDVDLTYQVYNKLLELKDK